MDQLPQRSFVVTEARGAIEAAQTGTAQRADAAFIQRETVLKRSVADSAEIGGLQRGRRLQTPPADRDTGETIERNATNSAVCREKKRKKSVGDRSETKGRRSRQQTTREGAPPSGGRCPASRNGSLRPLPPGEFRGALRLAMNACLNFLVYGAGRVLVKYDWCAPIPGFIGKTRGPSCSEHTVSKARAPLPDRRRTRISSASRTRRTGSRFR